MRCGRRESFFAFLQSETQRVLDFSGGDFVVTRKSGKNGQTGGVGRGPGVRTLLVIQQIPNCSGSGIPSTVVLTVCAVKFIEPAVVAIKDEDMAVSVAGVGRAFDGSIVWNRHGAGVAFGAISGELDIYKSRAADHVIRNADGLTVIESSAEVGMQRRICSDEVDDGVRVGINGSIRDVLVPKIVCRKRDEAVEIAFDAGAHWAAILGSRESGRNRKEDQSEESKAHGRPPTKSTLARKLERERHGGAERTAHLLG